AASAELGQVKAELRHLKLEEALYKEGDRAQVSARLIDSHVEADAALQRLQRQKAELELGIETGGPKLKLKREDPFIKGKGKELAEVAKAIEARRAEARAAAESSLGDRARSDAAGYLAGVRRKIAYAEELERSLFKEVEQLNKEAAGRDDGAVKIDEIS